MNILVTGGAGFIGSNLVKELLKNGHIVVAIDNFNNYYDSDYKHKNIQDIKSDAFKIFNADINKPTGLRQIVKNYHFNKIIHLAACVGVRNSLVDPNLYIKTNIEGTVNILEMAKELKIRDIVFASSSSVYGNDSSVLSNENDPCLKPLNPYAMSKRSAELLCYVYHQLYGLNITVLRFFTVYGPCGRPDMSPYIFTESLLTNKPINVNGDGSATRDFTYIKDIVNGILLSINTSFPYEIINLGSSNPISVVEFIKVLEKITGKIGDIQFGNKIEGESQNTYADITKAKKLFGFNPTTSLEDGMTEFVNWYRNNRLLS